MKLILAKLSSIGLLLLVSILLVACGSGSGGSSATSPPSSLPTSTPPPEPVPPKPSLPLPLPPLTEILRLEPDLVADPSLPERGSAQWEQATDAARFLTQASFGATAKDIDFIVKHGKEAWLEQQTTVKQTSHLVLLDQRLIHFGFNPTPPIPYFDDDEDVWRRHVMRSDIWWESAIWGRDQLRQRVAFALSQILVVSLHGPDLYARERGFANYQDILAKHALGNYRDLLMAVSQNPIMGIYLSSLNNPKGNEALQIRPDENYAREILQLFSIGLVQLNNDGSPKLDNQGAEIPTYDQGTVKEFARVFTGWSLSTTNSFGAYGAYAAPISNTQPMKAYPNSHDSGTKTLLDGEIIPAGNTPHKDMQAAIDNIMAHPNVGPFIGKKLIQYLITSNPSSGYVARVTQVFNDNGIGIKGDMKAVIKAIYLDPEARAIPTESQTYYGKLKAYPLLVSGLWRAFKAQGITLTQRGKSIKTIRYMSGALYEEQEAYFAPSVFNFYQTSYVPPGVLAQQTLLAPEFQIFTESNAALQANILAKMIYKRDRLDPNVWAGTGQDWGTDTSWNNPNVHALLNLQEELAVADKPLVLVERLNLLLTNGQLTQIDSQLIADHIALVNNHRDRIYEAIFLIVMSPEYAIQR